MCVCLYESMYEWDRATSSEAHIKLCLCSQSCMLSFFAYNSIVWFFYLLLFQSTKLHNTFYEYFCLIRQMIYFTLYCDEFVSFQSKFIFHCLQYQLIQSLLLYIV